MAAIGVLVGVVGFHMAYLEFRYSPDYQISSPTIIRAGSFEDALEKALAERFEEMEKEDFHGDDQASLYDLTDPPNKSGYTY